MSLSDRVAVCIVTWNSAAEIRGCLASIGALLHRPLELVIVDCASEDDSLEIARKHRPEDIPCSFVALDENLGFAGGMNRALAETNAPWVFSLNPDARPAPDYLGRLLDRLDGLSASSRATGRKGGIGAATGRLVRFEEVAGEPVLDACGMRLTLTWRHLDRGSGEPDVGQLARPERVFGVTGAASLFRREALDDAAVDGEVFDSDFHSFREDAELCFRLHERGWEAVYEPAALCRHRRSNLPERRSRMSAAVNLHSLKNRYLLRAYHQGLVNALFTLPTVLARDMMAAIYVLARERSSLGAYRWLWRNRRRIIKRRRLIRNRRTRPSREIDRWFLRQSLPLPGERA